MHLNKREYEEYQKLEAQVNKAANGISLKLRNGWGWQRTEDVAVQISRIKSSQNELRKIRENVEEKIKQIESKSLWGLGFATAAVAGFHIAKLFFKKK